MSDSFMKTVIMGLLVAGLMSVSFWASAASKLDAMEHKASAEAHKAVHAAEDEANALKKKADGDTDYHPRVKDKKAKSKKASAPAAHKRSHSDHH